MKGECQSPDTSRQPDSTVAIILGDFVNSFFVPALPSHGNGDFV
jgi:hypothetical protein